MAHQPFKVLTAKQSQAFARAHGGLPSHCKTVRKVGKSPAFGVLPRGVTVEVCRAISGGKDVLIARSFGPKRGGANASLRGAKTRKRRSKR